MNENTDEKVRQKKNGNGLIKKYKRISAPIITLLLIVIVVLAVVFFSKLSKEKELTKEKEQQIASLSSRLEEVEATAVYEK